MGSGELLLEGIDFRWKGVYALCLGDERKERMRTHPLKNLEAQSSRSEVRVVGLPTMSNLNYKIT